jgi:hypothetical protein
MFGERLRDRLVIGLIGQIEMPRPMLDDLITRAGEEPFGRLVRSDQAILVNVVKQDRIGRLFDHEPEALLAAPQAFLGALAIGDVVAGAGHADGLAGLVADDFGACVDDPLGLVGALDAEFDVKWNTPLHTRVDRVLHASPVVGMNAVDKVGQGGLEFAGSLPAHPIGFFRPDDPAAGEIPVESADMGEALGCLQQGVHLAQCRFGRFAFADALFDSDRPRDRRRQAQQVAFEHIILGAGLQQFDRGFVA